MSFRENISDFILPSRSTSQVPDEAKDDEEVEQEWEEDDYVPPPSKKKHFGGMMGEPIRIKDDEENSQEIAAFQGRRDLQAGGMVHPGIMNLMEMETTGQSSVIIPDPEPAVPEGGASLKREPSARTKYVVAPQKVSPSTDVADVTSSSNVTCDNLNSQQDKTPTGTGAKVENPSSCCTVS